MGHVVTSTLKSVESAAALPPVGPPHAHQTSIHVAPPRVLGASIGALTSATRSGAVSGFTTSFVPSSFTART